VLHLINGEADLRLAQVLATQATAMAVARYASSTEHPEHTDLRDACLRWIGNPWVDRMAWDAHARSEPARQMVEGWLKRHLIKNFFQLLAHDGAADLRRLNYWLKWESQITDMWFVLGRDAVENKSEPFKRLRKLMEGRERFLDDSTDDNNAFVMRIGPLLVIEFGVTNNACFAYAAADFKTSLERRRLSVHALKQKSGATKLSHSRVWEPRFDQTLRLLLQSVPHSKGQLVSSPDCARAAPPVVVPTPASVVAARPAPPPWPPQMTSAERTAATALPQHAERPDQRVSQVTVDIIRAKCVQYGISWEDNRPKKGAFWVLMADRNQHPVFAKTLETLGFRHTERQGFWIK
jgi:hypothetical protein